MVWLQRDATLPHAARRKLRPMESAKLSDISHLTFCRETEKSVAGGSMRPHLAQTVG
jgi:hypothetical protein